jgi:3-(3-hydroxy-phenyl)propionate hydroxylase
VDTIVADWFALHECQAALVRPDHVVFGVVAHTDEVSALLGKACRQLGIAPAGTVSEMA